MNPADSTDLNPAALVALRVITERLKVRDMGPADHIRTKHEVKAFVEAGDMGASEALLRRARERRAQNQVISTPVMQQRGQRMTD